MAAAEAAPKAKPRPRPSEELWAGFVGGVMKGFTGGSRGFRVWGSRV